MGEAPAGALTSVPSPGANSSLGSLACVDHSARRLALWLSSRAGSVQILFHLESLRPLERFGKPEVWGGPSSTFGAQNSGARGDLGNGVQLSPWMDVDTEAQRGARTHARLRGSETQSASADSGPWL